MLDANVNRAAGIVSGDHPQASSRLFSQDILPFILVTALSFLWGIPDLKH
jgi:hypothetical protein